MFQIQNESIGDLQKLRLRLQPLGFGSDWLLDKVIIECDADKKTWYFISGEWFDSKNLIREIPVSNKDGVGCLPMETYEISVVTGKNHGAGTDANVFVIMSGDKGDSGKYFLESGKNNFERAQTDKFAITCVDLGDLKNIRIGHDNSGIGPGWFCDSVSIKNTKDKTWTFPCRRWFDLHEDDNMIERDLTVGGTPGRLAVFYRITVITGTDSGAGTDANVYISILGTVGKIDKVILDNTTNNFETGQVDKFKISSLELGDIKSITIGHDGAGIGAEWQLDKVIIHCAETDQRWVFPCNRWIGTGKDDGKMERTLLPDTSRSVYFMKVWTGKEAGAGTDANVYCNLIGDKAESGKIELKKSMHHMNKFEAGHLDEFPIDCKNVGKITNVVIGHDGGGLTAGIFGKGVASSWFLDRIELHDQLSGAKYEAKCGQWLGGKKGDGKLEKKLPAVLEEKKHTS